MKLLSKLKAEYPHITFIEGQTFMWSPQKSQITYNSTALKTEKGAWTLLHELGHGVLGHQAYKTDLELVELEAAAWTKAKEIGSQYSLKIDENYIQDCMDTYRDWLHLRSTCPTCGSVSPQLNSTTYRCFNCTQEWTVTTSRFCRPYRRKTHKSTIHASHSSIIFN